MPVGGAVPRFAFELDEELSAGDLIALRVMLPSGARLQVWTQVELAARIAVLRQFAIYGVDVATGGLGWALLRQLADAAMETFDVDCIRIEEARRTSGAGPGRRVGVLTFRRRGARHPDAPDLPPPG